MRYTANRPYLRHLTDQSVDARYYRALGTRAREIQEHIRSSDDPEMVQYLKAWIDDLDPHSEEYVREYAALTGVDLTELPVETARVLLFYTLTNELPGLPIGGPYLRYADRGPLIDAGTRRNRAIRAQLSLGLAKLQGMGDPDLGLAMLNEVPELLKQLHY